MAKKLTTLQAASPSYGEPSTLINDLEILSMDGMSHWTNKILFSAISGYKCLLQEDEDRNCLIVELTSRQVKMILNFVQYGTIPLYMSNEDKEAFSLMQISLTEKQFTKVPFINYSKEIKKEHPAHLAVHCEELLVAPDGGDFLNNSKHNPEELFDPLQEEFPEDDEDDFCGNLAEQERSSPVLEKTRCELCYRDYCDIELHNRRVHSKVKTMLIKTHCPICRRSYLDIELHNTRVHSVEHKCPDCHRVYKSVGLLNKHRNDAHSYVCCDLCGKTLTSRKLLKDHMIALHGSISDRKYKCDRCPKAFVSSTKLREHINCHDNVRAFICEFCGSGFNTSGYLAHHRKLCTRENPRPTKFHMANAAPGTPGKKFPRAVNTSRLHELQALDINVANVRLAHCTICEKKFAGYNSLKLAENHALAMHHRDKCSFVCEICSKGFPTKCHLKSHLTSHGNEKKYICGVCGSKFNGIGTRNAHEKEIHLGIKKGELKGRSRRKNYRVNKGTSVTATSVEEETFEMRKARWLRDVEEARKADSEMRHQEEANHPSE